MASVGNLVVNLVANTSRFKKGMSQGQGSLKRFASGAAAIATRVAAPLAAIFGGAAAVSGARTQIEAERKLAGVLKATGGAAGLTAKQIATYASELQSVTNFGDEATINAAAMLATFKNIKGDVFKDVLANAQDMSAVLDQDLKSSIIQIGKAMNDPAQGVSALSRVGVTFTEQQKKQIKELQKSGDLLGAQKLVMAELKSEFGGAAQAMADPFTQMRNAVGDVAENIGFLLMPSINLISAGVSAIIGPVAGATDMFRNMGITIADFLVNSFLTAQFAMQRFGDIAELAFINATLAGTILQSQIAHFFVQQLPAWLNWFGTNWHSVWQTSINFVATALVNLATNVQKLFTEVWEFIKTGGKSGFNVDFTGLTEGFKNEIAKLPDIPPRVVSDMERQLAAQSVQLGDALAGDLSTFIEDRREEMGIDKLIDLAVNPPKNKTTEGNNPLDATKKQSQNADKMAGAISGFESGAFLQKLVAAQKKSGKTVEDKQLATQKKTENNTKKTNEHLQAIAEREPVQLATVPI